MLNHIAEHYPSAFQNQKSAQRFYKLCINSSSRHHHHYHCQPTSTSLCLSHSRYGRDLFVASGRKLNSTADASGYSRQWQRWLPKAKVGDRLLILASTGTSSWMRDEGYSRMQPAVKKRENVDPMGSRRISTGDKQVPAHTFLAWKTLSSDSM